MSKPSVSPVWVPGVLNVESRPFTPAMLDQLVCSSTFGAPDAYDWRTIIRRPHSVYTGLNTQGWPLMDALAFSARFAWFYQDDFHALSAQYILNCTKIKGAIKNQNINGLDGNVTGWKFFELHGTLSNRCIKYTDDETEQVHCDKKCDEDWLVPHVYRTSVTYLVPGTADQGGSEYNIRAEMYSNGPVTTSMNLYKDFTDTYWPTLLAGGNMNTPYAWDGKSEVLGVVHVCVVGWGSAPTADYWIVKTSWPGVSFDEHNYGENSYFLLRRGYNECGAEANIVAGLPLLPPGTMSPLGNKPLLSALPGSGLGSGLGLGLAVPMPSLVWVVKPDDMVFIEIPRWGLPQTPIPPRTPFRLVSEHLTVCPAELPDRCDTGLCALPTVTCTRAREQVGHDSVTPVIVLSLIAAAAVVLLVLVVATQQPRRANE